MRAAETQTSLVYEGLAACEREVARHCRGPQKHMAWLRLELEKQADARRVSDAVAAAARATARAAGAELEWTRQDYADLRAQHDALLRQLSSTQAERDRPLADLRASVEGVKRQPCFRVLRADARGGVSAWIPSLPGGR